MRSFILLGSLSCLAVTVGCSSTGSTSSDAGSEASSHKDSGHVTDAAKHDARSHDASSHDAGARDTGAREASSGDAGCGDSVIPEFVTSNLTLTKACSPWHAHQTVLVGDPNNNPVLTIDPGVTVLFDDGVYFDIGDAQTGFEPGGLQAVGTASEPIILTSSDATPAAGAWSGVYFEADANQSSAIQYATLEYAGGPIQGGGTSGLAAASVVLYAVGATTPFHVLLSNLTIEHNGGSGILFLGPLAGFASGSGSLTINDWTNIEGYPIVIDGNSADSIPTTLTTGAGGAIGIYQVGGGGQDIISRNVTWPSLNIPYVFDSSGYSVGQCGLLVDGTATGPVTLTIAAPNTIEFSRTTGSASGGDAAPPVGCGLLINTGVSGNPQGFPGSVVANGAADAGITFTSARTPPADGDWLGVQIFVGGCCATGASSFQHCTFSYASGITDGEGCTGSEINLDGYPCGPPSGLDAGPSAAPVIQSCTFTHFAGSAAGNCAICSSDFGSPAQYQTPNTFQLDGGATAWCLFTPGGCDPTN